MAVVHHGAAQFEVDATHQRADSGELFVLEPGAVHTGMAAVPEGWAYKVLYLEPELISEWDERDSAAPRAAKWVVFRDRVLRDALLRMHSALAAGATGLELDESIVAAVDSLRPHLRPGPSAGQTRLEHAAVRRARAHVIERWDERVDLASLSAVPRQRKIVQDMTLPAVHPCDHGGDGSTRRSPWSSVTTSRCGSGSTLRRF